MNDISVSGYSTDFFTTFTLFFFSISVTWDSGGTKEEKESTIKCRRIGIIHRKIRRERSLKNHHSGRIE